MEDPSPAQSSPTARATYEAMAPHYDAFTFNHDLELWVSNALPALKRHGLRAPGTMLDVACGTGKSLLPFLSRGWGVTGGDVSPAMLKVASAKVGDQVRFLTFDMRQTPEIGQFDLICVLGDALNYLLSTEDLTSALRSIGANLAPHGRLIFDVNALLGYRGFFAKVTEVETDDTRYVWRGHASVDTQAGALVHGQFSASSDAGSERVIHRQRHFPQEQLLSALKASGLEALAVYGHHYDAVFEQPADEERHTKFVYIAKRGRR